MARVSVISSELPSVISSELPFVISSERSESRNLLFGHARPDRASLVASFVILSEAKNLPAASVIPDLIGNLPADYQSIKSINL